MDSHTSIVAIIGGGFSGMMTTAHLCRKSDAPIKIVVINPAGEMGRGIAFQPYSELHLLNVMAGKMSAWPDDPDHFVNWILKQPKYNGLGHDLVSKTYLPRQLFGKYLDEVWEEVSAHKNANVSLQFVKDRVVEIEKRDRFCVTLEIAGKLEVDQIVLATGNSLPSPPEIPNKDFYNSKSYFGNPWSPATVQEFPSKHDLLIIGNGLTMVDTVLGLKEAGFSKTIYSISPDGFSILQHRHNGLSYPRMIEELREPYRLSTLVSLFNKHRKAIRMLGLSAEPVIDSLRPFTQKIWLALSVKEKKEFMSRLRHLWGVARHRLPIHVHDFIQRLKLDGKLIVRSGKILNMIETSDGVRVEFYNKKAHKNETILVERVINCTGPESDLSKVGNGLLRRLHAGGMLESDPLKQGALADPVTFEAINRQHHKIESFYLIGNILKGMLWESTAVPELRTQSERIASLIMKKAKVFEKEITLG